MDDYIKRELVIELLTKKQREICPFGLLGRSYVNGKDRDDYDAIEMDINEVQKFPAADVRPVVRGEWVRKGQDIYCSVCGKKTNSGMFGIAKTNYCSNCGAEMEKETK